MAHNSFGNLFRITTWGESHGKAIGVLIDGCPAGLEISEGEINQALALRAPGRSNLTSARQEADSAEILSGVFEGKTTGAPLCILIPNRDAHSAHYLPIKELLRPGHANYTYLEKYGLFDYRGGGRSSGRETACRVAAGAVAKKLLHLQNIELIAYLKQVGSIKGVVDVENVDISALRKATLDSLLFCPDPFATAAMIAAIEAIKEKGDSLGGLVEFMAIGLPAGLGDPVYEKLEANLADAMMSLPATKGFEMGEGFSSVTMRGSEHNDLFTLDEEKNIKLTTNHAGGTLGGISTGQPLMGRVAFKPTSSIRKTQQTVDVSKKEALLQLPEGSRHDPCIAIRAVPVVEAMVALVLVDALLLNRCARVSSFF